MINICEQDNSEYRYIVSFVTKHGFPIWHQQFSNDELQELFDWCESQLQRKWNISTFTNLWQTLAGNVSVSLFLESEDDLFLVKLRW